MNLRIYVVATADGSRLVRAASAKQAVKHCTPKLEVHIPSMEEYGALLLSGVKVEEVERKGGET
jgi:hypothetical protein